MVTFKSKLNIGDNVWCIDAEETDTIIKAFKCETCEGKGIIIVGKKKKEFKCPECGGEPVTEKKYKLFVDNIGEVDSIRFTKVNNENIVYYHCNGIWNEEEFCENELDPKVIPECNCHHNPLFSSKKRAQAMIKKLVEEYDVYSVLEG